MMLVRLQNGDGMSADRAWLRPIVQKCQKALTQAGFVCAADGRFGSGDDTPGSVQTALLSLAYNRGPRNPRLDPLAAPMDARDWAGAADVIANMQQDHELPGIRSRRRREAGFIRAELALV